VITHDQRCCPGHARIYSTCRYYPGDSQACGDDVARLEEESIVVSPSKAASTRTSPEISRNGAPEVYGSAHPKELLRSIVEDGEHLLPLENQHIIAANQFDTTTLLQLFRLAAKYESNPERFSTPLQGKILISAFYEPSTRTRLSFESAWHRLGGDIMSITDRSTTGIAKGESLSDVGQMFNNYADCVVLRDTRRESLYEMMDSLRIPIINAGNGIEEHPTQAMADLYTIFKWRPQLLRDEIAEEDRISIGIVGVPHRMRTVRSLLNIFSVFPQVFSSIHIFSENPDEDDGGLIEGLREKGLPVRTHEKFEERIGSLDVVYINAIAWVGDGFETYGNQYRLDTSTPFKDDAIVLHPLARGEELSHELDNTPHNWYFAQARGAMFIRMALLTCLVHRKGRVLDVV
jgi:aspartate carbamoyltransferase catalytic subunit